jgi:hypothetical protein
LRKVYEKVVALLGETPQTSMAGGGDAASLTRTCCIYALLHQDGIHPLRLTGALLVWLLLIQQDA